MSNTWRLSLFMLAAACAQAPVLAQTASITGFVSDYDLGTPIPGASLRLRQVPENVPDGPGSLEALEGRQQQGNWTLKVIDSADPDTGTLNAWSLEITTGGVPVIYPATGLPVNLTDPGETESVLAIPDAGLIEDINVSLDVTHTYIGDLEIILTPPSGDAVTLHNRSGQNAQNIQVTYDDDSGDSLELQSDDEGAFAFESLPGGLYVLRCSADFYGDAAAELLLAEDGTEEIFFNLRYNGCLPVAEEFNVLGLSRGTLPVAGGVPIRIDLSGVGPGEVAAVEIGGAAATGVEYFTDVCPLDFSFTVGQYLVCTAPPHAAGLADVRVVLESGAEDTLAGGVNYVATETGAVLHVRAGDANPANNGASWETALGSLQEAVDIAGAAGGGEVWVAAGVYKGYPYQTYSRRIEVVALRDGVALFGGFAGTETAREQRDWTRNLCVLDAAPANDPIPSCGVPVVVASASAELDGFVLQNGGCESVGSVRGSGLVSYGGAPVVRNCVFTRNEAGYGDTDAGGGAYVQNATATFINCLFYRNFAGSGAALFAEADATIIAQYCTFADNFSFGFYPTGEDIDGAAGEGGGADITLRNCIVGGTFTDWNQPLDTTPIVLTEGVTTDVQYCDVVGGFAGEGNFSAYPEFTGLYNLRLIQEWRPDSFQLRESSPCIDAGMPLEGVLADGYAQARPAGDAPDVGFHEFTDTDGDHADAWWETTHELDPEDPLDGALDDDDDTLDNAREYDIGTDPGDAADPRLDFYVAKEGDNSTGEGTPDLPWLTIDRGVQLEYALRPPYFPPARVHVGPGVYEEKVLLPGNVHLMGAGMEATTIQYFIAEEDDQNHVVVRMAPDAAIQDCKVTLPEEASTEEFVVLLRIENVSATVSNVQLDGGGRAGTFGIFISGLESSGSVVRDSQLLNLQTGIQTINSAANITRNLFDEITGIALFVDRPDDKGEETSTPLVGDFNTAETSGFNSFRDISGTYVQNNNPNETIAEINDWGVYTEAEIAQKMEGTGSVDFTPFIGKSILASSLAAGVFDENTREPIPSSNSPAAELENGDPAVYDADSQLQLFPVVAEGAYDITATAVGYKASTARLEVAGGSMEYVSIYLSPDEGGEGEGEGEGEAPDAEEAAELLLAAFTTADANADGALSLSEAQAQVPRLSEAVFNDLDGDGNGQLTQAELNAALPDPPDDGCQCPKSAGLPDLRTLLEQLLIGGLALGMASLWTRRFRN